MTSGEMDPNNEYNSDATVLAMLLHYSAEYTGSPHLYHICLLEREVGGVVG